MSAKATIRGVLAGSLGLAALQLLLSSSSIPGSGTSLVSGLFVNLSKVVNRYMDPTVPLIPDLRASSGTTPGGGSGEIGGAVKIPGFGQ